MRLIDPRRLTGPNLLSLSPLVLVDLGLDEGETWDLARDAYLAELARMRTACGWKASVEPLEHRYRRGLFVAFPDPIDVMLASTEMAEWAALSASEVMAGRAPLALEPKRTEIAGMILAQQSPALLALSLEAPRRRRLFLWDDEFASLGSGKGCHSWPRASVPDPSTIAWDAISDVLVALITGTNGKTTCARLLARCIREAGRSAGMSSTDGTWINGAELEDGDMAGPAGARQILRNPSVEVAVLETARGGILRRGLAVERAQAALITNVSSDHLGESGVENLATMAQVKWVITQVVVPEGRVVLNANDPLLMNLQPRPQAQTVLFAIDPETPSMRSTKARGEECWFIQNDRLACLSRGAVRELTPLHDIPITYRGAARHNVENALAVAAMARGLGVPDHAIDRALRGFTNQRDNPRRGNLARVRDVQILLDFGHNPEGVRAALSLVATLRRPPGRLAVITGFAGDRTPEDIAAVSSIIRDAKPGLVLVRELEDYLRGRLPGEVPAQVRAALVASGLPPSAIQIADTEVDALRTALAWAEPGDVIALLVHLDEEGVRQLLEAHGATVFE